MVAAERHHRPLVIIVIIDKCRHRYNSRPRSAVSSSGAARWSEEARRLQFTAFLCSSESAGVRFLGFIGQTLKLFHRLRKKNKQKKNVFYLLSLFSPLAIFLPFRVRLEINERGKNPLPVQVPGSKQKEQQQQQKRLREKLGNAVECLSASGLNRFIW